MVVWSQELEDQFEQEVEREAQLCLQVESLRVDGGRLADGVPDPPCLDKWPLTKLNLEQPVERSVSKPKFRPL